MAALLVRRIAGGLLTFLAVEALSEALDHALRAHRALGCRGCSRSDFRWDDERGEDGLFLLETNTQPGMTPLSLVPEQAKHCGMDYATLVEAIVGEALAFHENAR